MEFPRFQMRLRNSTSGKGREVGEVAFIALRGGRMVGFLEDEKSTTSLSKIMLMESP